MTNSWLNSDGWSGCVTKIERLRSELSPANLEDSLRVLKLGPGGNTAQPERQFANLLHRFIKAQTQQFAIRFGQGRDCQQILVLSGRASQV